MITSVATKGENRMRVRKTAKKYNNKKANESNIESDLPCPSELREPSSFTCSREISMNVFVCFDSIHSFTITNVAMQGKIEKEKVRPAKANQNDDKMNTAKPSLPGE
jgi:hypothetical protein